MKKCSGSISIYFVFAIVLIVSVVLSVTEIARINCQKLYLQIATDAALDSMASLYHRKLYDYYSLYGVEYRTKEMLETEYLGYMHPFFMSEDRFIKNWYIADINQDNINLDIKTLTDETYLEKEIINYTKYKLIGKAIKFLGKEISITGEESLQELQDKADELFEEIEKSSLYEEVYERYFDYADDIKTLENYARKISDYIDKVNLSINRVKAISTGGSKSNAETVLRKFDELNDSIVNLYNNLLGFRDKMSEFRQIVNDKYLQFQDDKASGNYEFDNEIIEFIESEFEHFISFVDEDSDMNKALEEGFDNCKDLTEIVETHYREIEQYVFDYESLEEDLKEARRQRGDDYDSDEIKAIREEIRDLTSEVSDYLKDVKESYKDIKMEQIQITVSTTNHSEKENLLNRLIGFKNGVLINLILDSDTINNISSENINYSSFNILSNNNTLTLEKILLGEYELDKFNYFNKELNDERTPSGSKKYEVERLITGDRNDLSCLKSVINQILLIRIAMNVLHIYKSADKRAAARQFAIAFFSGFSPLMVEVMFLVIITAWGTAQAIADLKKIMKNKRVNLMHDDSSWTVSVESILSIATGQMMDIDENDDEGFALNYKDYLRILLLKIRQSDIDARMASIIERNIKDEQESFDFEKMVYSFGVENTFVCRHFFTNFVFVPAKDVRLYREYAIKTKGYRCFYDNDK